MKTRTTLTKSLHTVTAVSRVAHHLQKTAAFPPPGNIAAVRDALALLGQPHNWPATDETFAKCVEALAKLHGEKS